MSAEAHPSPSSDVGPVELSVPLDARFTATVRTLAASLGADAGFSVDELDDVRLALSEVFSALVDASDAESAGRALVSFSIGAGVVRVGVKADHDATSIELDELALGILRSVTDECDASSDEVVFVKRATEAIDHTSRS